MIRVRRIKKLNDFGIFQDFSWDNNTTEFSSRNIIYGWNYSGKTTLSRLFESLSSINALYSITPNFFIDLEEDGNVIKNQTGRIDIPIYVFNNDYVDRNLHFHIADNPKIKGVLFDIGEESSDKRKQLHEAQEKIRVIEDWLKQNVDAIEAFAEFDKIFTTTAKSIKNDVFESSIEFTRAHLKKELAALTSANLNSFIIKESSELAQMRFNALQKNPMSPVSFQFFTIDIKSFISQINECLNFSPTKVKEEAVLNSTPSLYSAGREFINFYNSNPKNRICAFCGNTISENRIAELNAYYTNEASKLRERIDSIHKYILSYIDTINSILSSILSQNDLIESIREDYEKLKHEYHNQLNQVKRLLTHADELLEQKVKHHLFEQMKSIDNNSISYENYQLVCSRIQALINRHNQIITNFDSVKNEAIHKLKLHYIAKLLKERNYFQIKAQKDKQESERNKKNEELSTLKQTVYQLQSELTSIVRGQEKLNEYIRLFLGRNDLSIKSTEDKFFLLLRGDSNAINLSEGEKSAIAFSYFLVFLENVNEQNGLDNAIIFIDDPISSLDNNHIAQVSSLINNFFFRKDENGVVSDNFAQLFISTHNFEFFTFIRDANNIERKKNNNCCRLYLLKRLSENNVVLSNLPKAFANYDSEYLYLFSEIYAYYTAGCPEDKSYIMPNVIRRFLEIYTRIKLPGNHDEIDNRLKILTEDCPNELKLLHHFSHLTTIERAIKHSELILKMPELTSDVIEFLKLDKSHFDSLISGI